MISENRISGIDIIGNIPWGTHFCLFFQTKEDLIDILVPYFKAGLENNEFCCWAISEPLEEEMVKESLKVGIPDINFYLENGQIEITSHADWHANASALDSQMVLNHLTDKIDQALINGYEGLRYSGNVFFVDEKSLDSAISNYPVKALCTYSLGICSSIDIIEIAANHQFALGKKDGKWKLIESSGQRNIKDCKQINESLLKETLINLDRLVKERTAELEEAYNLLKENEKGLAEAQKMAHLGSWDWNLVTDEVYWSDELFHIFGLNPQKSGLSYDQTLNYIHPDDRNNVCNAVEAAASSNEGRYSIDHRIVLDDGSERVVHAQGEFIFDERNAPIRMKGILQDITERKEAEEKLRESEEKYRNIVETSNEGIYFVDDEGKVTFANKMMETSGYSLEEIIGKPVLNFVPEESLPVAKKEFEKRLKGISGSYELKLIRKDGSYIWAYITAKPFFNKKGKFKGYLAMMTDITERKETEEKLQESEEKYRNIVETANEGIVTFDNEETVTFVNNKAIDTLGYAHEEIIGRPIWNFISNEHRPIVKMHLKKREQGLSESYELKLIRKNGSPIWVFLNAKPLFDKNGRYVGVMSMLTDITPRKEAEEALAKIEQIRIKEIHHRIKNNLQVISSLLDLQSEKFSNVEICESPEVLEAFNESKNRVISMALIHEELYKGNKIDTLDFASYLDKLTADLFGSYNLVDNKINLKLNLEQVYLNMDTAIPLGIIVNELVSNSFKHAFSAGRRGEIQISLRRAETSAAKNNISSSDGDCVGKNSFDYILEVSDNGRGIPKDIDIRSLNSLGLQLVNILVEQIDGCLELKRDPGTEFSIWFNNIEA